MFSASEKLENSFGRIAFQSLSPRNSVMLAQTVPVGDPSITRRCN